MICCLKSTFRSSRGSSCKKQAANALGSHRYHSRGLNSAARARKRWYTGTISCASMNNSPVCSLMYFQPPTMFWFMTTGTPRHSASATTLGAYVALHGSSSPQKHRRNVAASHAQVCHEKSSPGCCEWMEVPSKYYLNISIPRYVNPSYIFKKKCCLKHGAAGSFL